MHTVFTNKRKNPCEIKDNMEYAYRRVFNFVCSRNIEKIKDGL